MSPHNWPEVEKMPARIARSLSRGWNAVWASDRRIVDEAGLTWVQFSTLVSLRIAGGDYVLSPTSLYGSVQASSGGMTKALHALTRADMIVRIPDPADKRGRLVQLTPVGRVVIEEVVSKLNAANRRKFLDVLTEEEAEQLAFLLKKLGAGYNRD